MLTVEEMALLPNRWAFLSVPCNILLSLQASRVHLRSKCTDGGFIHNTPCPLPGKKKCWMNKLVENTVQMQMKVPKLQEKYDRLKIKKTIKVSQVYLLNRSTWKNNFIAQCLHGINSFKIRQWSSWIECWQNAGAKCSPILLSNSSSSSSWLSLSGSSSARGNGIYCIFPILCYIAHAAVMWRTFCGKWCDSSWRTWNFLFRFPFPLSTIPLNLWALHTRENKKYHFMPPSHHPLTHCRP